MLEYMVPVVALVAVAVGAFFVGRGRRQSLPVPGAVFARIKKGKAGRWRFTIHSEDGQAVAMSIYGYQTVATTIVALREIGVSKWAGVDNGNKV